MALSLFTQISYLEMLLVCAIAGFKGGAAERWASLAIFLAWVLQLIVSFAFFHARSQQFTELSLLFVDGALAVALLVLSLIHVKIWLGVAMLLQSLELGLHGAVMADYGLPYKTYIAFNNLTSFFLLFLLLIATVMERRVRVVKRRSAESAVSGIDRSKAELLVAA